VEDLIAKELAIARELIAAKRRERALLALKKKKLREGQLEQIDAYLLNVEQASFAAGSICSGLASSSLQLQLTL
jgi:cell division protein FtsL